jgi:putative Ca2+/H+ antiporter (TMEM165/GDT1 family)
MNWRILITTFGVIFLAEMGDKTQLAAMTMAAETRHPWMVFIGASMEVISNGR